MKEEKYNGLQNYPTWAVNLWINNDEGLYLYFQEQVYEAKEENPTDKNAQLSELGQRIKDFFVEYMPEVGTNVYSDLIGYALDSVNYWEIAESMLIDND